MDEVDEFLYGADDHDDGADNLQRPSIDLASKTDNAAAEDSDIPYEPPDEPYEPADFSDVDAPAEGAQNGGDARPAETGSAVADELEDGEDEEDEEDSDDDIEIVLEAPAAPTPGPTPTTAVPQKPVLERRTSISNVPVKAHQPVKAAAPVITPLPRQDGTVAPPVPPPAAIKSAVDIEATGQLDGKDIYDVDLDTLEDKPWRRPGADISDYFNFGFNEQTWKAYCAKQKQMREALNMHKRTNASVLGAPLCNDRLKNAALTNQPVKRMRDQDDAVIQVGGDSEEREGTHVEDLGDRGREERFQPDAFPPEFHGPPPPMGLYGGPEMYAHMPPPFMGPEMGPGFDVYRHRGPMPPIRPGMMRPIPPAMRGDRPFYMDEPIHPYGRDMPPHRAGPPFERGGPPHGSKEWEGARPHDRGHDSRQFSDRPGVYDRERERRGGKGVDERDGQSSRKRAREDDYHGS
ncbi:hypothetical protein HK104_006335 [Borealophlyctis nickersoniae]|nr:hypothetical protein HK104_006335 [Borealophlyctis nickersoniae]